MKWLTISLHDFQRKPCKVHRRLSIQFVSCIDRQPWHLPNPYHRQNHRRGRWHHIGAVPIPLEGAPKTEHFHSPYHQKLLVVGPNYSHLPVVFQTKTHPTNPIHFHSDKHNANLVSNSLI